MRISPLAASLLMLCSCVTADEEGEGRPTDEEADWRTGGKGDGETCDFEAMSAQTYYDQFAYSMVERPSGKWYRVGLTWDIEGRLDNGNDVDLNVYFLAGNRVIVEYSEQQRQGGGQSEVLNETVIVTRATIDPTTRAISIAGLGTGTPLTVRRDGGGCTPGIAFQFGSDVRSPGLTGDNTVIQAGFSSGYVIDPDHLDQVPNATARKWFEEDVASGKITVVRK